MINGINPENQDKKATDNFINEQIIGLIDRVASLEADKKHWVTEGAFQKGINKQTKWTVGTLIIVLVSVLGICLKFGS